MSIQILELFFPFLRVNCYLLLYIFLNALFNHNLVGIKMLDGLWFRQQQKHTWTFIDTRSVCLLHSLRLWNNIKTVLWSSLGPINKQTMNWLDYTVCIIFKKPKKSHVFACNFSSSFKFWNQKYEFLFTSWNISIFIKGFDDFKTCFIYTIFWVKVKKKKEKW